MGETFFCQHCQQEYPSDQTQLFQGKRLCSHCLEENTVICRECGQRIWTIDNAGTNLHPLCQSCYDRNFTSCTHCGALIRQSSAFYRESDGNGDYPFCDSCYYNLPKDVIKGYYYKPEPIFYGEGPRYMGVELEIDEAGESNTNAGQITAITNIHQDLIYCKHDSSLEDGFEIVTHPMSLSFHQNNMPWAAVLKEAVRLGYRSHQAATCGLHVHVSRAAFGQTEAEQDVVIARILYFFEKFWDELLKFSRRTPRQLQQWAARYGYKEQPMEILDHAKKGDHRGRYTCVNLTNADTIEFRIFRGTLKYNTLIAALQLLDRICDVALYLSDDDIKSMSWTSFAASCTALELVQYLKERQLYVNEPVETEVEI